MAPPRHRTAAVCDESSAHSYSHARPVVRPATVMPGGRGVSSSVVHRAERSAMRERYSEVVGSVGIHSGCATLNDTNDFSIFPSFDISCSSDTFVGIHVQVRVDKWV